MLRNCGCLHPRHGRCRHERADLLWDAALIAVAVGVLLAIVVCGTHP